MSGNFLVIPAPLTVIPAKAGIHIGERGGSLSSIQNMDPRLRGNDEVVL